MASRGRGGMADTLVLGANALSVWVQVPPPAPNGANLNLVQVYFWQGIFALQIRTIKKEHQDV